MKQVSNGLNEMSTSSALDESIGDTKLRHLKLEILRSEDSAANELASKTRARAGAPAPVRDPLRGSATPGAAEPRGGWARRRSRRASAQFGVHPARQIPAQRVRNPQNDTPFYLNTPQTTASPPASSLRAGWREPGKNLISPPVPTCNAGSASLSPQSSSCRTDIPSSPVPRPRVVF
jgi:hypothetical protein